ncbi:hypothetical protein [Corynebacterium resistens]|uniref:Rv1157c family protein n=1 Tax=Corynebacterium resistens TaxID=258224 RepID=UPI002356F315|nr:hypothetical protein [Corynebacterium resistens]
MALSRYSRRALAALTAAGALAAPAVITPSAAQAAPQSSVGPIDHLGRPAPHVLNQLDAIAKNPQLPKEVREKIAKAVSFFRGDGKPGVKMPKSGPAFTQFGWPTVSGKCIGGKNKAVGTAMAVPGPAKLPLPGVKAGEVNFVFTGLGTGKVAKHQKAPMNVRWINLNTGKVGLTKLGYNGINPDGPATVNGAAKTGRGTVLALLEGGVTTYEKESGNTHCSFLPTAAMINVR